MMEKQKILIIDDDLNIRKTLSDILKAKGFEPLLAQNGTEGLELLRQSSANLVIIDLGLPDMSGIEVLDRVRADHPSTEAIMLTGNASLDSAIEATNKGAFSYLQKPCEIEQLMLHIRRASEKHEAEEKLVRHNLDLQKMNAQLSEINIKLANEVAERRSAEEALVRIQKAVESSGEAIGISNPQGRHFYQNKAFLDLFEYSVEELNEPLAPIVTYADPEVGREVFETIMQGVSWMGETIMVAKSGRRFPVFLRADAVKNGNGDIIGFIGIHTDITGRKQAEQRLSEEVAVKNFLLDLNAKAPSLTDKDLYDYVLDYVVRFSGSTIGFFHLVSDDQKNVLLTTWNTEALRNCTASYATHYPLDQAGNWVDCVRFRRPVVYNEFSNSPNRKGLPEGHTPVKRFMSVPVVEGDKVRIIFGVGNKSEEYSELDAFLIQVVANDLQRIMAQRRAEKALSDSEAYFRSLIENSSDIITIVDGDGIVRYISPSLEHVAGRQAPELIGRNIFESVHPDDLTAATDIFTRAVQTPGVTLSAELRMQHNDGSWHIFEILAQNLLQNEAVKGIVINSHDITARRRAEEALLNSEQKLKAVLYGSPIPQFVIDRDHRVVYWNNALEEITRFRASEVIGTNQHWRAFYGAERPCLADLMVDGAIERIPELYQGKYSKSKLVAGAYEATDYFPTLGEDGRWLSFTAVVIRDVNGRVIGALETMEDVTERKQAEEEIFTLSITDPLTGLHNRRGFITFAEQQLKLSDRAKRGMLLFFADLDGMKWINDTFGHEEGDKALMEVAAVLKETFRLSDILARMGGDEFAVLSIDSTEVTSEIFTTRLQERIDAHNHQENRRYRLSISVGCSCYDPETPCSLAELMVQADQLMYEHKRNKKQHFTV